MERPPESPPPPPQARSDPLFVLQWSSIFYDSLQKSQFYDSPQKSPFYDSPQKRHRQKIEELPKTGLFSDRLSELERIRQTTMRVALPTQPQRQPLNTGPNSFNLQGQTQIPGHTVMDMLQNRHRQNYSPAEQTEL
ncbi:unnamed protein product [Coregonus sp. 'balchen']|nr:unnamed protein product [Coregonus sp. 'balchen']